jgi:hypothetical protein
MTHLELNEQILFICLTDSFFHESITIPDDNFHNYGTNIGIEYLEIQIQFGLPSTLNAVVDYTTTIMFLASS